METQTYTLKDLEEGRVACILDESYENYKIIHNYCFPNNTLSNLNRYEHFYNKGYKYLYLAKPDSDNYRYLMMNYNSTEGLPTQSVKVFLKEIEEKDPLKDTPFHKPDFSHLLDVDKVLEKGIKNSGLNDKSIEELEEHFKDNINPSHYKRLPKETIERIKDNLTPEEFKGYLKGNILKYLDRYQDKNGVEDLKKANWYLNKLIEIENGKA